MITQRKLITAMSLCAAVVVPNIASAVAISGQGTWGATLQARDLDGNLTTAEAYYDTVLGITWLADANYGYGSVYDNADGLTDGQMNWTNANAWAASLDMNGDSVPDGWRLPNTIDVGDDGCSNTNNYQGLDCGYNITTHSEMSHMFYVTLGNVGHYSTSGDPQPNYGLSNSGPFSNLESYYHWSATEYLPDATKAWLFDNDSGSQYSYYKSERYNVWSVHAGDVGAPTVPIPAAAYLFGSGLLGIIGWGRRKASRG